MKDWIKISLILCSFGFFREMRPSEPFVTEFLSDDRWRNVTQDQVNREIYPFGTYSYLAQLCVVFLITDVLRYKPIIVASALVGLVLWSLLLWTSSLGALYVLQVCYGFFMAAEIAYYTYMYAKVERERYQKVTGNARASMQTGRFFASVLSQILRTYDILDIRQLNYISLGAQAVSLPFALSLPSVGVSIYMWSYEDEQASPSSNDESEKVKPAKPKFSWERAKTLLWQHFVQAYSDFTVLTWSIWWALAMAGFLIIQSYVQLLWLDIDPDQNHPYNGAAEAAVTLLGAISCLAAGFISSEKFEKYDFWILTACSFVEGVMIIVSSYATEVWTAYAMYICFGATYMFMITLASATVAKNLAEDSFALIFGINTLLALVIQTIMTVVVISETGFGLSPRHQFLTFGGYFVALAAVFLVGAFVKLIRNKRQ